MKKLVTICFLVAITFTAKAQNIDEDLQKLMENTSITLRKGYTVRILFLSDKIFLNYSHRGFYSYKWSEIAGLGITKEDRVYLAFNDDSHEYVTPDSGVSPEKIVDMINDLKYDITGKSARFFNFRLTDTDY